MRFNFNNLFNEKHALKVFYKGESKKQTLLDLNNKALVLLNLPKTQTFSDVCFKRKPASKLNPAITWKLVSRFICKNKTSYLQKPATSLNSVTSFFYQRKMIRRKKLFLLYHQGFKDSIPSSQIQDTFLRFRTSFLNNSLLSSKLYFLNLHKDTPFLFQKSKTVSVGSNFYKFFDKKQRKSKYRFFSKLSTTSELDLYSNVATRLLKNIVDSKVVKKNNISKYTSNLILHSKVRDENQIFQEQLLTNYLNLNETIKKTIKKTVKATSSKFLKQKSIKNRSEQLNERVSSTMYTGSKQLKKFYKGKSQGSIRNDSEFKQEFTENVASKKPRVIKKSFIKFKLPVKFTIKID